MLPSGSKITVGNEKFQCPEALFDVALIPRVVVQESIYNSIMKCDIDIRNVKIRNIHFKLLLLLIYYDLHKKKILKNIKNSQRNFVDEYINVS